MVPLALRSAAKPLPPRAAAASPAIDLHLMQVAESPNQAQDEEADHRLDTVAVDPLTLPSTECEALLHNCFIC